MLDTDTLEFLDLVSAGLNHTADLAVFPFFQDDSKCIRADTFYFTGLRLNKLFGDEGRSFCEGISGSCR